MRKVLMFGIFLVCLLGVTAGFVILSGSVDEPLSEETITISPYSQFQHALLDEVSGMVKSNSYEDLYWVHNDSGDDARIFAINAQGETIMPTYSRFTRYGGEPEEGKEPWQGFNVLYSENVDWEDIAIDENYLYLADTGNNGNARQDLVIYAVSEIDATASTQTAVIKRLPVSYPEQTDFPPSNKHYDSESLFVDDGALYLVTKHRTPGLLPSMEPGANLYRLDTDYTEQDNLLTLIDSHSELTAATGADLSPDGRRLAIISYTALWIFDKPESGDLWLSAPARKIPLNPEQVRQVESVSWDTDASLIFTNEQGDLFRVDSL